MINYKHSGKSDKCHCHRMNVKQEDKSKNFQCEDHNNVFGLANSPKKSKPKQKEIQNKI